MRPIRLEIEGLASLRERQTIDFTELEDLFVITGPTGSGKTSILDGLAFALYGQIPRANQDERREFISVGKDKLQVQLDFEADGVRYRIAREYPRSANRSQQVSLEEVIDSSSDVTEPVVPDGGVRDINPEVEEILGLDFNSFTKSVLLPQNEFQEFMQGDPSERRNILKRLLGLEALVKAGSRARTKQADLEGKADTLEKLVESEYEDATEERLDELQSELDQAKTRHAELRELKSNVSDRVEKVQEYDGQIESLEGVEDRLEEIEAELESLKGAWSELKPRKEDVEDELEDADQQLEAAEAGLEEAEDALAEVEEETGGEERLTDLGNAYTKVLEEKETISEHEKSRKEALDQFEEFRTAHEEAERAVGEAKEDRDDVQEALTEANEELDEAEERLEAAQARSEAEGDVEEARQAVEDAEELVKGKEDVLEEAKTALEEAEEERDRLAREHKIAELTRDLESGDPCPVCERELKKVPSASDQHKAIKQAKEAVADAREEVEKRRAQLSGAREELAAKKQSLEEAEKGLEELPEIDVGEARREYEQLKEEVEKRAEELDQARQEVEELEQARKNVGEKLQAAKQKVEAATQQRANAKERRDKAAGRIHSAFPESDVPDDLEEYLEGARRKLQKARSDYEEAKQEEREARVRMKEARAAKEELREQFSEIDTRIVSITTRLTRESESLEELIAEDDLPEENLPDQGEVDRTELLESLQERRAALNQTVHHSAEDVRDERAELLEGLHDVVREADVGLDEFEGVEPVTVAEKVQAALTEARDRKRELNRSVEETCAAIETRRGHEETIEEHRDEAALYQRLGQELQADRFLGYVLEESFEEIARRASDQLREISRGQYSLEAEGSGFVVIDHANADERRSVVTLSGGETFLASLSLALALAGSARDIAGDAMAARLDAMFIDEGFDALDQDTLDVVIDAVEQLQQGERMVGLITHVPQLAERMPSAIEVESEVAGSGSQITVR